MKMQDQWSTFLSNEAPGESRGFLFLLKDFEGFGSAQVVPGVAVFFEFGHAAFAGREDLDSGYVGVSLNGDHVPDIVGDDVADNEIDVTARVPIFADVAAGMEGVSVERAAMCGFDLHAPAAAVDLDDEVVAVALSPRLGDAEAERGGFVEESGFGDLTATFGGRW